jgi:hypothetical protein
MPTSGSQIPSWMTPVCDKQNCSDNDYKVVGSAPSIAAISNGRQKHEADLPYPRGEAGIDVQKRAWPVLAEIVRLHSCDVAIVTHGGHHGSDQRLPGAGAA